MITRERSPDRSVWVVEALADVRAPLLARHGPCILAAPLPYAAQGAAIAVHSVTDRSSTCPSIHGNIPRLSGQR